MDAKFESQAGGRVFEGTMGTLFLRSDVTGSNAKHGA